MNIKKTDNIISVIASLMQAFMEMQAKNLHKPLVSSCCQHIWGNMVTLDKLHIEYYCSKCGKKRPVGNYC